MSLKFDQVVNKMSQRAITLITKTTLLTADHRNKVVCKIIQGLLGTALNIELASSRN